MKKGLKIKKNTWIHEKNSGENITRLKMRTLFGKREKFMKKKWWIHKICETNLFVQENEKDVKKWWICKRKKFVK